MNAGESPSIDSNIPSIRPRVAFQGAPGAFSELAIHQHWPTGAISVARATFTDAVRCVIDGDADFAMIPVENVIAGPVNAALDALAAETEHYVQCGELKLNVRLCLMAPMGSRLEKLRDVLSHPMALAQCKSFFSGHSWLRAIVYNDTAAAAHHVSMQVTPDAAAIASEAAASRYGLEILARDIQDIRENWTRFVVLRATTA